MKKPFSIFLKIIPFLVPVLTSFLLPADEDFRLVRIREALSRFDRDYRPQKVYLHIDKTRYKTGEDIWFKAYAVDAVSHKPLPGISNLYVELVNPRNTVVQVKLIKLRNGTGWGDFSIRDTTPEGNYLIRAYTSWMNNFEQEFFFCRNLYIENPNNKNFISSEDIRFNRKYNRKLQKNAQEISLRFFPEGGNLVEGMKSVVAFKLSDQFDRGIEGAGILLDDRKNKILDFKTVHAGMGSFVFTPEKGRTYYAEVSGRNNEKRKFRLPEPLHTGYVLHAEQVSSDKVRIWVETNKPLTQDPLANDVILMVQVHGKEMYSEVIDMPENQAEKMLDVASYPAGVCHITLFDGRGIPRAERLLFLRNNDWPSLVISGLRKEYDFRRKAEIELSVTSQGKALPGGSFSLSVAELTDSAQAQSSIFTYLLLDSDLHGTIENPLWYFENDGQPRKDALDLLMLTHGWRRFRWESILAPDFKWPSFEEEKGITITGKITRDLFGIPIRNAKVYLTILNAYNDYFETKTDRKGRFRFDNLDYPDTISVVIEARKPNGRKNLVIIVDENEFRPAETLTASAHAQMVLAKGEAWKYKNVKRIDYSYNPERQKILERSKDFKIHGEADNVIYMDDIPEGYTDMLQVLQGRVPGVLVQGNTVTIRGPGSIMLSNDPLFLVDGVPVDINAFRSLNPKDVELIEIIKGPNASIYGSRGANGVIAVYTKRGEFMKRGFLDFKMLGYATPREFYSPDYSIRTTEGINDLRTTLYWKPDIVPDSLGKSTIRFFTSDIKGTYLMKVEGITADGKPLGSFAFFTVGN